MSSRLVPPNDTKPFPTHLKVLETLTLCVVGDAGWSGYPGGEVLRHGGGVQRHGHGAPRAQPRGPLQLLQ